jgi:transcriptional regulator with XRE-family HTH domain
MNNDNVLEQIGKQIKSRREFLDVSQKVLSMHSGVPQSRLPSIEKGSSNITIKTLEALAEVLGMEVRLVEKGSR